MAHQKWNVVVIYFDLHSISNFRCGIFYKSIYGFHCLLQFLFRIVNINPNVQVVCDYINSTSQTYALKKNAGRLIRLFFINEKKKEGRPKLPEAGNAAHWIWDLVGLEAAQFKTALCHASEGHQPIWHILCPQ